MENRKLWLFISFSGFMAVALGAFGAHGLADKLNDYQLTIWNKAVSYQFYHTLAAAMVLLLPSGKPAAGIKRIAIFFLLGILLFSGSLYLLACKDLLNWTSAAWLGPLTPLGGIFFLSGWVNLFIEIFRKK